MKNQSVRTFLAAILPLATSLSVGIPGSASTVKTPEPNQAVTRTALAPSNAAMTTPRLNKVGQPSAQEDKSNPGADTATPPAKNDEAQTSPSNPLVSEGAPCIEWIDHSQTPKAAILCIHGLSLHKGTFDALGKRLSKDGYAVYALDVRGFGDWVSVRHINKVDLNGSLVDIEQELKAIHKTYPDLPVIILGESMGGGIALHATALYPNLIAGLISSVPAGDRFGQTDEDFKVGIRALLGGFNKQLNVGWDVVDQATKKEDLRNTWGNDPLVRMKLSPHELLQFQEFMGKNFESAKAITNTPVLFIQGMNDKLVRPAGTWKLCEALSTPDRQIVFSKSAEHLILEESQFSEQDVGFIENWLKKHVLASSQTSVAERNQQEVDGQGSSEQTGGAAQSAPVTAVSLAQPAKPPSDNKQSSDTTGEHHPAQTKISYWIELYRNGKTYRCNNKYPFKSGDSIRFHIKSENDGYAYIVMKQGTSGKQAVLFPEERTGLANDIAHDQDYPLPTKAWLTFDNNPGVEKLSIIFSVKPLDSLIAPKEPRYLTAYVSPDSSGAKDLVPARMQLSWQDPDPVIIPQLASDSGQSSANNSLVMLSCQDPSAVLSLDIALAHN